MFGDRALPISILNAAFHKVTRPISYNEGDLVWERDFEIACSLWKKHFNDEAKRHHDSKEVSMELNLERKDRDYLYVHPYLQEKISWGLVPYVQALLLARFLRGDIDAYPPFMWK